MSFQDGEYAKMPIAKQAVFKAGRQVLKSARPLRKFIVDAAPLKPSQRALIVGQAIMLLENFYAHLPLKCAMYAVDPLRRLRLLRHRLPQFGAKPSVHADLRFHAEMIDIFTSIRDLHTKYFLPAPFQNATAYLPFDVETFFYRGNRKYLATHFRQGRALGSFAPGVEIVSWNGIPIARAAELAGEQSAGSNPPARLANGLMRLTKRPLSTMSPPDEEFVIVGYRTPKGRDEVRIKWKVLPALPAENGGKANRLPLKATELSLAHEIDHIRQVRKLVCKPHIAAKSATFARATDKRRLLKKRTDTMMPDHFKLKTSKTQKYGYIRIYKFPMDSPDSFVEEFKRLVGTLPQNGLIIDVRDNPGGKIAAAEQLLQLLTPRRPIEPERLYFINTPLTLRLCELQAHDYDLRAWIPSIERSMETGATFSGSFPISSRSDYCNEFEQVYRGPVVLVTNALSYSAAEFFAAGFQDHRIGTILGTDNATGAAGAHVKDYATLRKFFAKSPDSPFKKNLPQQMGMTIALRRSARVGPQAGTEVEDFGITPDICYPMTRTDLLENNADLIEYGGRLFAALSVRVKSINGRLRLDITTETIGWEDGTKKKINEIDILVDWRVKFTKKVPKKTISILLDASATKKPIEIQGFIRTPGSGGRNLILVRRIV